MKKLSLILIVVIIISLCFIGCSVKRYNAEYDSKFLYNNARDSYPAGKEVTLYFDLIATDTNYSFTLNGEPLDFNYDEKKGFVIKFIMPEEDVYIECHTNNSMYAEGILE